MFYSELRKDYFLNKYVVVVPRRGEKPSGIRAKFILTSSSKLCPFCPTNVMKTQKIIKGYKFKHDGKEPWSVLVIENKFPITAKENKRFYGRHEVIIETPDHDKEFAQLSIEKIAQILDVYIDQTKVFSKDKNIEYVLIFKNNGGLAGASIIHSHSQVFASSFLPPDVLEEAVAAHQYRVKEKKCPYCSIIEREENGPRLIEANSYLVAFTPYASFYSYEAWIFPRRHIDNITNLNDNEKIAFAKTLKKILSKIEEMDLSYNFFLHQIVSEPDQHFYFKIQPRKDIWGGVELGSGLVVNTVPPEKAAAYYRR